MSGNDERDREVVCVKHAWGLREHHTLDDIVELLVGQIRVLVKCHNCGALGVERWQYIETVRIEDDWYDD